MFIVIILLFSVSMFADNFLRIFDLNVVGIEYAAWSITMTFLVIKYLFKGALVPLGYFHALIIVLILCVLNGLSDYVLLRWYLMGFAITLLMPITYIVFYNVYLEKNEIANMIKKMSNVLTSILVLQMLLMIMFGEKYFFYKENGLAASSVNICIIMSLATYGLTRNKKYLIYVFLCFASFGLFMSVKSFVVGTAITFIYMFFLEKNALYKVITVVGVLFFVSLFSSTIFFGEIQKKFDDYLIGENIENMPRNALYIASINMANDKFPFGTGQGTFGGYPSKAYYGDVYYDYGLNKVHGLRPTTSSLLRDKRDPGFMLDTYWSSIIGEMGYIGFMFYLFLFLYPAYSLIRFLKRKIDLIYVYMIFVAMSIVIAIAIESIYLAIPYQIGFIIFYSGFTALVNRCIIDNYKGEVKAYKLC